jgi:hypothetical protein
LAIYELAYNLHLPVHQILDMPYEEFLGWFKYFNSRPVGWREDNRTAMLLSAQGVKKKPQEIFPSLKAIASQRTASSSHIDPNLMKLLKSAKQGDQWDPTINYEEGEEDYAQFKGSS